MSECDHLIDRLSESQRNDLNQFRGVAADVLKPSHDDVFLVPWLIARDFNVSKAEKMLRDYLEWSKTWKIEELVEEWKPPEVLVKYYPLGYLGNDKEGCPVWMIRYGVFDMYGILQSVTQEDYIRYTIQFLEKSKLEMKEQTKKRGKPVYQQVFIFDMEGLGISKVAYKPAIEIFIKLIIMFEANYPEELKVAHMINAPRLFSVLFSMIKPFFRENTLKKVMVYHADETVWLPEILKHVDKSILPKHWGGDKVDSFGDPKCASYITPGPEPDVPKYYYIDNNLSRPGAADEMLSALVPKGDSFVMEYQIRDPQSIIKYEFWTKDHDISFGVKFETSWGIKNIVKQERVNSHDELQRGQVLCKDVGNYKLTFDNTYSLLRAKKLFYTIDILPPSGQNM